MLYHGNPGLGYVLAVFNDKYCITPGITVGYNVGVSDTDGEVPRYPHTKLWLNLRNKFRLCHSERDRFAKQKGPCLELVGGEGEEWLTNHKRFFSPTSSGLVLHALRSRTLTSAGMDGVESGPTAVYERTSGAATNNANTTTETTGNGPPEPTTKPAGTTSPPPQGPATTTTKHEELLWKVLRSDFGIDPAVVRKAQDFLVRNRKEIAHENSLGQCTSGHSCKDKARQRLERVVGKGKDNNKRNAQQNYGSSGGGGYGTEAHGETQGDGAGHGVWYDTKPDR